MTIFGSCLPKPGKCPEKPLIALSDRPQWFDISTLEITLKPRSCPISVDEGTTIVIKNGIIYVVLIVVPSIFPEIRYDG